MIKVTGNIKNVEVEISKREIAYAIQKIIINEYTSDFDDPGCDWTTTKDGKFCLAGDKEWEISNNPDVATLVDAANILLLGRKLMID